MDPRRRRQVLAVCCLSMIVVVMDVSVVNVALPAIHRDLHASIAGLQWTVDAYTLVLGAFLVVSGASADRFGRRRLFRAGLVVFGIGSVLCGLAPGIGWLIAARALQALGGSMLNPVATAIVAATYPEPAQRARAIGVFSATSGLALALGPILGGALIDEFGWRSVFWINVPVVVVALVGTVLVVPESRADRARRADPVGQFLFVTLLGSVIFAVIESGRWGWGSWAVLALLGVAGAALLGIVYYEPRRRDPLLELSLFRRAQFGAAIATAILALCAFGAFLFVTTLYLQDVRGMSALAAGLALLPIGLLIVLLSPLTGRTVARHGPRLPLAVSATALVLGAAASLWSSPATPLVAVLAIYLLFGVFQGTINPPISNTAVSGAPRSMTASAASLASTGRQVGITLGIALAGTITGSALSRGGSAFTSAEHGVWWLIIGLGVAILALCRVGTRRRGSA